MVVDLHNAQLAQTVAGDGGEFDAEAGAQGSMSEFWALRRDIFGHVQRRNDVLRPGAPLYGITRTNS